jgi:hypothetical protein
MNKTALLSSVATATALMSTPTMAAEAQTANDWVALCNGNPTERIVCYSYARGLADALILWQISSPITAPVCIGSVVNARQLVDVGVAFIQANTRSRTDDAGAVLAASFLRAWPCKR